MKGENENSNERDQISLDLQEDNLALELQENCDRDKNEINPAKSAEIFHKLAAVYEKRQPENIKDRMICLIKSAALFNAAILRSPDNVQQIQEDLKAFCANLVHEANAEIQDVDLIKKAQSVAKLVKQMRDSIDLKLTQVSKCPENTSQSDRIVFEVEISKEVEKIQNQLATDYTDIMAEVAKFAEETMGKPPCEYSLAGMGSLARKEITPYSDFENVILLQSTDAEYENMLNYFRWYSVIFQIVLINLGETIIPSVSISSLNDKNSKYGDWFYDNITPRGICFDGMMPHACKFPLGRTQPTKEKTWKTELIKPVNEMLKYLNSEESLKNGYHLSTILTKTCHVYGNVKVFEQFENGATRFIKVEQVKTIQESVTKQITEDLAKFATRQSLVGIIPPKQFNVKQVIYRSTTILISEMGRYYKITTNSCFETLKELAAKNYISENTKQKLGFAVALACLVRLKWYMFKKSQNDNIDSITTFLKMIGKQATVSYFRIAYALQCDISKRFHLKKFHLYSNPKLLNVSLAYSLKETYHFPAENLLQDLSQKEIFNQRYYEFDYCMACMEEEFLTTPRSSQEIISGIKTVSDINLRSLAKVLMSLNCFDDALECYERLLMLLEDKQLCTQLSTEKQQLKPDDIGIHREVAKIKHCIGYCLMNLGKYDEAKTKFESSLQTNESLSHNTEQDSDVAKSLYQLGVNLTFLYKLDEALIHLEKSLQIRENISSDISSDLNIAQTEYEIARCFIKKHQVPKALKSLQRALHITEKASPDKNTDRDVSRILQATGFCCKLMGDLEKAKDHFQRVIAINAHTSTDVTTDKELAYSYHAIGCCLRDMEKPKEAKAFLTKTLLIVENSSLDVTTDRDVAIACHWIGRCLVDMNKLEEGKLFLEKALLAIEKTSKHITTDVNVACTSYWIGRCLMLSKKPVESRVFLQRALAVWQKRSDNIATDYDVAETSYWIGLCFMKSEMAQEAKIIFEKILKFQKKTSRDATTDLAVAKTNYWIGRCLLNTKNAYEAKSFLEKALLIYQRSSNNVTTDCNIAKINYWIGWLFRRNEKNRRGSRSIRQSIKNGRKQHHPHHTVVQLALTPRRL